MALKDNLKFYRDAAGLTLEDVAPRIGVSAATLNRYESGVIVNVPSNKIEQLAIIYGTTPSILMGWGTENSSKPKTHWVKVPVLGRVRAGIPTDAIEEIIGYEEVPESLASTGDFFGLQVQGDSMIPRFVEGDVVIVRKQSDIESGKIGVVLVNGSDATIKKIVKHDNGISLIATNTAYTPRFYTNDEITNLPVEIIGTVVQLIAKFI